jgi:hypothetical protein
LASLTRHMLEVFFCWYSSFPASTQTSPASSPLLSSQFPGHSYACSGRRGLLLAWIQLEAEEEKPVGKETVHSSLGTETKGSHFPFVPAREAGHLGGGAGEGLVVGGGVSQCLHSSGWDQTTVLVPCRLRLFLVYVCGFKCSCLSVSGQGEKFICTFLR